MKVYISGPITDDPDYLRHFQEAEDFLRARWPHAEIVNPTKCVPFNPEWTWKDYMKEDIKLLVDCNAIFMMKGWTESRGANLENEIAVGMEMVVIYAE